MPKHKNICYNMLDKNKILMKERDNVNHEEKLKILKHKCMEDRVLHCNLISHLRNAN